MEKVFREEFPKSFIRLGPFSEIRRFTLCSLFHEFQKKSRLCQSTETAYSPEVTIPESGFWRVNGFNALLMILFSHCTKLLNSQRVHSVSSNYQGMHILKEDWWFWWVATKSPLCHSTEIAHSPELTIRRVDSGEWLDSMFPWWYLLSPLHKITNLSKSSLRLIQLSWVSKKSCHATRQTAYSPDLTIRRVDSGEWLDSMFPWWYLFSIKLRTYQRVHSVSSNYHEFQKSPALPRSTECLLSRTHYPESGLWRVTRFNALLAILFSIA